MSTPAPNRIARLRHPVDSLHALSRHKHHHPRPPSPTPEPTPSPAPSGNKPGPRQVTLPNVHVPGGQTEIEAVLTIDRYEGLQKGRNGTHEIAYGHITLINAVGNKNVVGTQEVELAMNVKSSKDPAGLPRELPLKAGDSIEVEGVYIPAKQANDHGDAVIHFTHSPDGYVIMPDGSKYA